LHRNSLNPHLGSINRQLNHKIIHQFSNKFLWETAALVAVVGTMVAQLQKRVSAVTIAVTQSNNLEQVLVKALWEDNQVVVQQLQHVK
jgi:hypothetical protein